MKGQSAAARDMDSVTQAGHRNLCAGAPENINGSDGFYLLKSLGQDHKDGRNGHGRH